MSACNLNGCGANSDVNTDGTKVQTEPAAISTLREGSLTNEYYIQVLWDLLTLEEENGSSVTSINLQSREIKADDSVSEWQDLFGFESDHIDTEYILSEKVSAESVYEFRIRCKNKWGWAPFSQVLQVQPSTWPSPVLFDLFNHESGRVEVRWYEPNWHNSQVDKEYTIEVQLF